MGLLGSFIGAALDVAELPIAVAKDVIPGGGGFIDGHRSETEEQTEELADRLRSIREQLEDL